MYLGKINTGVWLITFKGENNQKFFWCGYCSNEIESKITNNFRALQSFCGLAPFGGRKLSTHKIKKELSSFLNSNGKYSCVDKLLIIDCDLIEHSELNKIKINLAKRLIDLGYRTTEITEQETTKHKNLIDLDVLNFIDLYKGEIFTPTDNYKSSYNWQKVDLNKELSNESIEIDNTKINSNIEKNIFNEKELLELLKIESILQDKTIEQLFDSIISDKARKIYSLKI